MRLLRLRDPVGRSDVVSEMIGRIAYAIEPLLLSRIYAQRVEGYTIEASQEFARAALEAIEQAGFVIVPREPTDEMIEAGLANNFGKYPNAAWEAMLDAALTEQPGMTTGRDGDG